MLIQFRNNLKTLNFNRSAVEYSNFNWPPLAIWFCGGLLSFVLMAVIIIVPTEGIPQKDIKPSFPQDVLFCSGEMPQPGP